MQIVTIQFCYFIIYFMCAFIYPGSAGHIIQCLMKVQYHFCVRQVSQFITSKAMRVSESVVLSLFSVRHTLFCNIHVHVYGAIFKVHVLEALHVLGEIATKSSISLIKL